MLDSSSLPPSFSQTTPWEASENSIWLSSVFILHRNLAPFPFPSKMNEGERHQTFATASAAILPHLSAGKTLSSHELSTHTKELLFEHFILSEGFEQFEEGKGMIIDDSSAFLGLLNVENHIHIHLFENSTNWEEAYRRLDLLDHEIGRSMEFAFSKRFGHLTSDPMVCGTGLAVQTFLHLPALIHTGKFTDEIEKLGEEVTIRGLGQKDEFIADLVLIENKCKLGVTEPDILKVVHTAAQQLTEAEQRVRQTLESDDALQIKDFVSRAFAILKHAQTLQIEETLTSLSLFELGCAMGWIEGGEAMQFKKSFFTIRRAHLHEQLQTKEPLTKQQLQIERAKIIRNSLATAKLQFERV